jgi:hypothetical protein
MTNFPPLPLSRTTLNWGSSAQASTSAGPKGTVRKDFGVVLWGRARGVDGVAHRAALEAGGRTLAVLANGSSRRSTPAWPGRWRRTRRVE